MQEQRNTNYEKVAVRVVRAIDLSKVTDYNSFKQELLKAGRTQKPLLNFFGRSKGGGSGAEKIFESSPVQSRIKLKGSINEDKRETKRYKFYSKNVKHKDIPSQKGKIKAVKRQKQA